MIPTGGGEELIWIVPTTFRTFSTFQVLFETTVRKCAYCVSCSKLVVYHQQLLIKLYC